MAASQDNAEGLFLYGQLHESGLGVEQDHAKALAYYKQAANKKHAQAKRARRKLKLRRLFKKGICW